MSIRVIPVRGHYEVYINGLFVCSEDTYYRAVKEAEKYMKEKKENAHE